MCVRVCEKREKEKRYVEGKGDTRDNRKQTKRTLFVRPSARLPVSSLHLSVHKRKCSLYTPSTGAWRMHKYWVRFYVVHACRCMRVTPMCIDIYLRASMRAY